ncbi:hypothetical protein RchiOBHm_Chr7g0222401 [Rosa chinensis]|uniref:Uncharacterized protein n=1 Tax=Rosa chinensis TaxID=74649 RepID=A0A2P6PDA5_ROSCH|nr:hypothetical protein RchiOBHm_Chr7g0222401 [Rosa chinensis]
MDSLRRDEDIVSQSIGCQIQEVLSELECTVLSSHLIPQRSQLVMT